MKLSGELKAFQERLGYRFARPELLAQALTHASMSSPNRDDNQRFEFLGDRVLNLIIADALYRADRDADEGQLAPRYNALVRKETCAEIARFLTEFTLKSFSSMPLSSFLNLSINALTSD